MIYFFKKLKMIISNFFMNINFRLNVLNYVGQYRNGLYHGKGRLEFKDGSVYEGQFENNTMNGYGKIFFKDGSIYQGNFKKNLRDGTGIFRNTDGSQQRVIYHMGKFKEVYTENYTFHWKNTLEGTLEVTAENCSEAADIFYSLSKKELLNKSKLSEDINKLKVTDISLISKEGLYN